jgi:hypothetical protein
MQYRLKHLDLTMSPEGHIRNYWQTRGVIANARLYFHFWFNVATLIILLLTSDELLFILRCQIFVAHKKFTVTFKDIHYNCMFHSVEPSVLHCRNGVVKQGRRGVTDCPSSVTGYWVSDMTHTAQETLSPTILIYFCMCIHFPRNMFT